MSASENKTLLQHIFAELAQGNSRPFVDSMAPDFSWTVSGTAQWSRKYEGKRTVIGDLFGALQARLVPPITTIAHRFIADEDYVAVEARGKNTTKDGKAYNNSYCFVFRLAEGKLLEVTEYLDVMYQQVIPIGASTADRRSATQTSMRAVTVVLQEPTR